MMSKTFKVKLKRLDAMRAVFFHSLSNTPEEDAWNKAESWAREKGILKSSSILRIFGRNIYPTENPEPYGYGIYIIIPSDTEVGGEVPVRSIPRGLYAVVKCNGLEEMSLKWPELWKWVENSEYHYIDETKGEYGYELGFEEYLNWYSTLVDKSESKMLFNLMLRLKEK
jgi:DNA gyrase inhibitor GyrI